MDRAVLYVAALSVLMSGCSTSPLSKYQTPYGVRNPIIEGQFSPAAQGSTSEAQTMLGDSAQIWVNAYRSVKAMNEGDAGYNGAVYKYVDTGVTYSKLLCSSYFDRLDFSHAHRNFAQKELGLLGGLSSALMGLAGASSGAIAATGSTFGFGGASFDAYNEAFLFGVDIRKLQLLVKERQSQKESDIFGRLNAVGKTYPESIDTLAQAQRALDDYVFHCTQSGIMELVNDSVGRRADEIREENTQ
ncbi:hypothetical protein [Pseudomonas sp. AOB-7]|uniref:hypothetical protein n=1 Tax=Pseudomonas sp. AOB-7 TaxID=2482750 RepID=UPI0011C3CBC6|nr:hypothetical protein [Pseudomonas sp. AOB-7]